MAPHPTYPYTGRLIIRLTPAVVDRIIQQSGINPTLNIESLEQVACVLDLTALCNILRGYPGLQSSPVASEVPFGRVLKLEQQAAHSPYPPVHHLASYYVLDPRAGLSLFQAEELLGKLQELPDGVERVYREPELRDAATWAVVPNDQYAGLQEYVTGGTAGADAFKGINAKNAAVWGQYDGAGIGFVDLETGWNLGHEDLPAAAFPVFNVNRYTPQRPGDGDHGTAVLGVVVGVDNTKGIVGIAPKATLRRVVSRIRSATDEWDLVNAILAALAPGVMVPGDVLLIEVETVVDNPIKGYPVEIVDHWFDAIRLAVGNGMIVVEPAGNGYFNAAKDRVGRDLDQLAADWPDAPTWRSLDRTDTAKFLDSGAIMVSACTAAVAPNGAPAGTHRRMDWATFGSRIDCYAWGEKVFTAGYGYLAGTPSDEDTWYTDRFNGTSSASAIIAGAALLVQQMHFVTRTWRLSPAQMRALLSDKSTGITVVDNVGNTAIGVMPDVAAIAGRLGAIPDVFLRDSVGDTGTVPNQTVFQSPDIIVRQNPSPDPDGQFGQTSPLANATPNNDPIRPGLPNYMYVRLRNRSYVQADGVVVRLYWSEASSLVAPVHWHAIGQLSGISVPGGGNLVVAGPLGWIPAQGNLPVSGHGCFVAVVDHPLDPRPPLVPGTATWGDFIAYVGNNNNVAWRNFTVLQPSESASGLAAEAFFVIRGAWDEARRFRFEVLQRVPDGCRIWWEVPRELAVMLRHTTGEGIVDWQETPDGCRVMLRPSRFVSLPALRLSPDVEYPCRLHVELPGRPAPGFNQIVLRQIFEQTEVGRLTWEIGGKDAGR